MGTITIQPEEGKNLEEHLEKVLTSLDEMLKDRCMTQEEFAKAIGMSPSYVSRLRKSKRRPSWKFLYQLCDQFQLDNNQDLLQEMRNPLKEVEMHQRASFLLALKGLEKEEELNPRLSLWHLADSLFGGYILLSTKRYCEYTNYSKLSQRLLGIEEEVNRKKEKNVKTMFVTDRTDLLPPSFLRPSLETLTEEQFCSRIILENTRVKTANFLDSITNVEENKTVTLSDINAACLKKQKNLYLATFNYEKDNTNDEPICFPMYYVDHSLLSRFEKSELSERGLTFLTYILSNAKKLSDATKVHELITKEYSQKIVQETINMALTELPSSPVLLIEDFNPRESIDSYLQIFYLNRYMNIILANTTVSPETLQNRLKIIKATEEFIRRNPSLPG